MISRLLATTLAAAPLVTAADARGEVHRPAAAAASACGALVGAHLGPATVTGATVVAGTARLPGHCRVLAYKTGKPIFKMIALLPTNWSGELLHQGGGGFKGRIPEESWNTTHPLQQQMVFVAGNGGHDDPSGRKLASPENMRDYVYASLGADYEFGQAAAKAYYGSAVRRSYFLGCSGGGAEALQAAMVYPERYAGIVSQAPVGDRLAHWARLGPLNVLAPLSKAQWAQINRKYIDDCDVVDGLKDGIVSLPGACLFDPSTVSDWTPAERQTIAFWFSDIREKDGSVLTRRQGFGAARANSLAESSLAWARYVYAVDEANYDPKAYSLERYRPKMIDAIGQYGFDPDPVAIAGYLKRGGKMLLQSGLDDGSVSPYEVAALAERLKQAAGPASKNLQVRWLPGVNHCGNRPAGHPQVPDPVQSAPDAAEDLGFMREWIQHDAAPAQLLSERRGPDGAVINARPVCLSGEYPKYRGQGDLSKAASFTCTPHPDAL